MINWEEKMNNNFYEIPSDWYGEFGNNYMDMYNMPEMFNMGSGTNIGSNLAEPKVALDRGNLFNNLYEPYRNYKYRILNNPDFISSRSALDGLHAAYVQHDSKDPQAVGGLKSIKQ